MRIIDRYVYAVTRNLPQKQRAEVEKEIRNLIKNMMSMHEDIEDDERKVEKVLLELGDPNVLSEKYSEHKKFIIGPQNYYNYMLVLKVVLGSILFAVTLGYALKLIFSAGELNLLKIVFGYIGGIISGLAQGFIWVTVVFAIFDYKGVNTSKKNPRNGAWEISDLPEIPQNKALIPKSESIFSIIFSTVFIMILYLSPQYFGVIILDKSSQYTAIPIFNIEVLNRYKILLFGVFLTILIKEVLKIIAGRWSLRLSLSVAALNIAALVMMIVVFSNAGIFNGRFPAELIGTVFKFEAAAIWNIIVKWFVVFYAVGTIIDTSVVLYKGVRYNDNK